MRHPSGARADARRAAAPLVLGTLLSVVSPAGWSLEPPEPIDVTGWVTELWEPLETYGGQLLPNPAEEVVAILHRRAEVPGDDQVAVGSRGLAIFGVNQRGRYYRIALAEHLLPCVGCLGTLDRALEGTPFEVDIHDRELILSWISNADGLVSVRLTLAWAPSQRGFALVRDEVVRLDPRDGVRTRRVRDYRSGEQWMDGRPSPLEPRFIPIESVSADDYR